MHWTSLKGHPMYVPYIFTQKEQNVTLLFWEVPLKNEAHLGRTKTVFCRGNILYVI